MGSLEYRNRCPMEENLLKKGVFIKPSFLACYWIDYSPCAWCLFCFLVIVALVEISHCALWIVLFGHFVCFLAVWVVDAQPGPWGGWLRALLLVLVCARQPALLVLPAAQEHGHHSQRACRGSYWKMWVSAVHGHRQVSEFDLMRMPFLSNLCPYIAGMHVASCIMAL